MLGWLTPIAVGLSVAAFCILLGLPLLSLFVRVPLSQVWRRLGDRMVLDALGLSLRTTFVATVLVILIGVPTAWLFAYRSFPGKRIAEALLELPIVLPPTVAGLALLLAFGRMGLAGGVLHAMGRSRPFTSLAVIVAQTFVAMPFFLTTAVAGLRAVDQRYRDAAATLGATPAYAFARVLLPLALPALAAGLALAWERALGEFGAPIKIAGNLPGRTQTMPLAVYAALETDLTSAIALAIVLLALAAGVLLAVRLSVRFPRWRLAARGDQ